MKNSAFSMILFFRKTSINLLSTYVCIVRNIQNNFHLKYCWLIFSWIIWCNNLICFLYFFNIIWIHNKQILFLQKVIACFFKKIIWAIACKKLPEWARNKIIVELVDRGGFLEEGLSREHGPMGKSWICIRKGKFVKLWNQIEKTKTQVLFIQRITKAFLCSLPVMC